MAWLSALILFGSATFIFTKATQWMNWRSLAHIPGYHSFLNCGHPYTDMFFSSYPSLRFLWPFPLLTEDLKELFRKKNSNIISITSFSFKVVLVNDPELVKQEIFAHRNEIIKPTEVYYILELFGKNVVTVEGEEWRRHRKLVEPAFSTENLQLVAEATCQAAKHLFKKWDAQADANGDVTTLALPDMTKVTLSIISKAAFGIDFEESSSEGLKEAMTVVSEHLFEKLFLGKLLRILPVKRLNDIDRAFAKFEGYIKKKIDEKREAEDKRGNHKPADQFDLVSLLSNSPHNTDESELNLSEITSNSFIMLLAGHETTAHTLSFALGLIAVHPEVQQKMREEIATVLGDDTMPQMKHSNKLMYCRCIIKEALRLFPPVSLIPKKCVKDVVLGGYLIPAGTHVPLVVRTIMRNPAVWPEPLQFKPERFLTEEAGEDRINPFSFVPFSVGSRSCVGQKFAMIEAILLLALIVQQYSIILPPEDEEERKTKANNVTEMRMFQVRRVVTDQPFHRMKLVFRKRH